LWCNVEQDKQLPKKYQKPLFVLVPVVRKQVKNIENPQKKSSRLAWVVFCCALAKHILSFTE